MKKETQTTEARFKVGTTKFEEELTDLRTSFDDQKSSFEQKMKFLESQSQEIVGSLKDRIEALEKKAYDSQNVSLKYCYNCIMKFLGKNHRELKIDDLARAIVTSMKE